MKTTMTWKMTAAAAAENGLCRETKDLTGLKLREGEALAILCNSLFFEDREEEDDWDRSYNERFRQGALGEFWRLSPEAKELLASLGINDPEKVDFNKIDSSHPLYALGQSEGWEKVFPVEGDSCAVVYDTQCLLVNEKGEFSEYHDDYVWDLEVSPIIKEDDILTLVEKGDTDGLMDYLHQRGL